MPLLKVDEQSFDQVVLDDPGPVLLSFWAPWCGPALKFEPVVEALADELQGRVKVFQIDTDESQDLPFEYELQSIPTLVLLRAGKELTRFVGRASLAELREGIEAALAP